MSHQAKCCTIFQRFQYIYYDLFWNSIEPILQTNMQIELSLGLATSDYEYQS